MERIHEHLAILLGSGEHIGDEKALELGSAERGGDYHFR